MEKYLNKKDKQEFYERISKYFEDISKLVFGGVILSSIMKQDVSIWLLLVCGLFAVVTLLYISFQAYKKSKILKNN